MFRLRRGVLHSLIDIELTLVCAFYYEVSLNYVKFPLSLNINLSFSLLNLKGEINGGIMETQMSRTITPVQVRLNRVMQGFR